MGVGGEGGVGAGGRSSTRTCLPAATPLKYSGSNVATAAEPFPQQQRRPASPRENSQRERTWYPLI